MNVELLGMKGYHFLWIDDYLWMWDLPVEKKAQRSIAEQAFGDVLIAGYGLGLVSQYVTENPAVQMVLTIERHQEIIQLCKKTFGKTFGEYVVGDFYEVDFGRKFDIFNIGFF